MLMMVIMTTSYPPAPQPPPNRSVDDGNDDHGGDVDEEGSFDQKCKKADIADICTVLFFSRRC